MSSYSTNTNQNNIYPKPCNYGCNTQIYWNTSVNEYWEVFSQKKHLCTNTATTTKPYYYKKPFTAGPKPKMSNFFELLTGPISEIQKKYEILSDIVTEYNGKVMVLSLILLQIIYS